MKEKYTVLFRDGLDAIKIRTTEAWASLMIGRPSLGTAHAIRLTHHRARLIAAKLQRWADGSEKVK